MKIIALTDIHAKTGIFRQLAHVMKDADLVLLCGDITHFGREKELSSIITQLKQYNNNILGITGNCDYPEAGNYLVKEGISLDQTVKTIGNYRFFGIGGSLPCPGKTPNEYSEEEYEALLNDVTFEDDIPLILVSHQPPFGVRNDEVTPGYHVGSHSIRKFIEMHKPVVCFTGHIHEGIAIDHVLSTAIINPGPAGAGNYAFVEMEGPEIKQAGIVNLFK